MKKEIISYICLWLLAVGYYFVIVSYSAVPAEQSAAESKNVTKTIVEIAETVTGKKSTEKEMEKQVSSIHGLVRKCAHVLNFILLAFAHSMLFYKASRGDIYKTVLVVLCMGICGAALDEFSQLFVEGRACRITDIFVDFTGSCLGSLAFFSFKHFYMKEGMGK